MAIKKIKIDDAAAVDINAVSSDSATTATTANKLATARTIQANLASSNAGSFDGSSNVTIGVRGSLPLANGGTGSTTAAAARANLATAPEYGQAEPSSNLFGGLIWIAVD